MKWRPGNPLGAIIIERLGGPSEIRMRHRLSVIVIEVTFHQ